MRTRHATASALCRTAVALLTFWLLAVTPATAQQVPDATIQRLADIEVKRAEISHLWNDNQIDGRTAAEREAPLLAERQSIDEELAKHSPDEQNQAQVRVQGLVSARLAILQGQWQREAEQKRAGSERQRVAAARALPAAAAEALNHQRQRILLQRRRDRGEITAEDFEAEDKKELDAITAIRDKFIADHGGRLVDTFDGRLQVDTQRLARNPEALEKAPPVKATGGGTARPVQARPFQPPPGPIQPVDSGLSDTATALAVGVLVLLGVGGVVLLLKLLFRPRKPATVSDIYGTAHFAPMEFFIEDQESFRAGVFLGKSSQPDREAIPGDIGAPIYTTPENHSLIVARTRTGKGTRVIIPTLLRYAGSALVLDPKGENAAITARTRRDQLGQNVFIVNPWNVLAKTYAGLGLTPATYNPLDLIDRQDPNAVSVAQSLADAICPTAAKKEDQFWQGSAAGLLTAVFLWLADTPGERKTLGRAREITGLSQQDFATNFLVHMAASGAFAGAIKENSAPFVGMAPNTYSGVLGALNQNMRFLSDPQIKAATATSSFSMSDLLTSTTTIYIVIPPDRIDTQKTWLRLMLSAGMNTFKNFPIQSRKGHRSLFLVDEFGSIGRLDDMPREIATIGGYGLDLALIVQGLDQLKAHYGDERATILSNCAYKWFCNIADLETAKWLSEALGKKTVETKSTSSSSSASGVAESVSHGETGRNLLNPDEILNLNRDVAIAMQPTGNAHYLRPVDYWDLERLFADLKSQYRPMYWDPPLKFDPNPYHAKGNV